MRPAVRFDPDFFGGAAGFEEPEVFEFPSDYDAAPDIDPKALQSCARRQLLGSIVAACFIAATASLLSLRPAPVGAEWPTHKSAVVQQALFAASNTGKIAAGRRVETPWDITVQWLKAVGDVVLSVCEKLARLTM